jgi:hypothetical protein
MLFVNGIWPKSDTSRSIVNNHSNFNHDKNKTPQIQFQFKEIATYLFTTLLQICFARYELWKVKKLNLFSILSFSVHYQWLVFLLKSIKSKVALLALHFWRLTFKHLTLLKFNILPWWNLLCEKKLVLNLKVFSATLIFRELIDQASLIQSLFTMTLQKWTNFNRILKTTFLLSSYQNNWLSQKKNLLNMDTPFFKYLLTVILHMELGSCFRIFKPVIQFLT